MHNIKMVDLGKQYNKIKEEINTALQQVIDSASFINGAAVKEFQENLEKYLNTKHVIPCANGTDALQISMMALGLKAGDEIITTSFTFIATVEVIALLGLTPVLVDVDPKTFNINPEAIRKAITPNTKAILPVHLFGQCADMEEILAIAREHNLFVLEDNCQAIGADYFFKDGNRKKAGTIGTIGCTSFFPSKNLGAFGDAGAIFTDDDALAKKCRIIANHGMETRYYHDVIGVNSRLDSMQAAILNVKLKYLDAYARARQAAADYYDRAFAEHPKLRIPYRSKKSSHVFHQYTVTTQNVDRDKLQQYLSSKNIPAMIYYPVPLHLQKAFGNIQKKSEKLPITESLCNKVLSLPMHTELEEEQLNYITKSVLEFVNQ